MDWILTGGQVLGADGFAPGELFVADGRIAEEPAPGARRFDATGLFIAPGVVDLHGDGFERNFSPRPKVFFDVEAALLETDRQLIANGITTAYLALTISWEPGLRSRENARRFVEALDRLRPRLMSDMRLQLRWEVFALDAVEDVSEWLRITPRPTLAFNDHFSLLLDPNGQFKRDFSDYAVRAGLTVAEYADLTRRTEARSSEVPAAIERLAAEAAALGVPCLAHDETTADTRRKNRALGIAISEFPLSRKAAQEAAAAHEPIVLGAPNVVRGGSHIGALNAEPAAVDGLCTALASDYYYPSLLAAAARMMDRGQMAENDVWNLVSGNPARAAGLTDRDALRPGARADIVVFGREGNTVGVDAVFTQGKLRLATRGM